MSIRWRNRNWPSFALFALAGLSFLLPFATVSCDQARTTFTGAQLVAHSVPRGGLVEDDSGSSRDIGDRVENDGSTVATVALAAAVTGLAVGLLRFRRGPGWCAMVGLGATLALAARAADPFGPTIAFHSGFWVMLLAFTGAAALHAGRALLAPRRLRGAGRPDEPTGPG